MTGRTVVVDTNVFGIALGNDPLSLAGRYAKHLNGAALVVSFQTVAELRYGALKANWGSARVAAMETRIQQALVVPPHDALAHVWAHLRNECRKIGHPLHDKKHHGDLWIAATAHLAGVPLVTHDSVFRGTPGLTIVTEA